MVDKSHQRLVGLQEKYRQLYKRPEFEKEEGYYKKHMRKGGFFTEIARNRLLGVERKSGRDRKDANFWYDVRTTSKTALIDLQLLLETAEDRNIHRVLNREALKPILYALFYSSLQEPPKQGAEKAKIAQLLIEYGLEYLRKSTTTLITSSQERMIDDAIDVSKQLTALLLPDSERVAVLREGKM